MANFLLTYAALSLTVAMHNCSNAEYCK